ncbi:NAD(P)-dependent oxidoreductase [Alteribacter populi]|uniref:NAD(P)-dependent oxidoreductase n=1 Tax=Alteribacter populi TaxID=2011011 RepID=UPI000BBAB30D|nr:NAD(P)-dependent oxidoreductase [Alteribacter populi]
MNRIVILGGLDFFGFYLSQSLMNRGIEVIAVQEMPMTKLEYDLNSFFVRNSLFSLAFLPEQSDAAIDRVRRADKFVLNEYAQTFESAAVAKFTAENDVIRVCRENDKQEDPDIIPLFTVKVPTLYGPYQPEKMVFATLLTSIVKDEWTFTVDDLINEANQEAGDLLYVEDTADALADYITGNGAEDIQLTSGRKKRWKEAFCSLIQRYEKLTKYKEIATKVEDQDEKANDRFVIIKDRSIDEGIEEQFASIAQRLNGDENGFSEKES